jgi:hypothetical protein
MTKPINPPPVTGAGRRELPAYVANGVVGLRVREIPLTSGMTLISGYAGQHYERQIEAAAVAPYPLAGDLAIDGVWLSDAPHAVSDLEQAYDFSTGELTTKFAFEAEGKRAEVEVVTFASRCDPTLVCQEIAVTPRLACSLGLRAIVDAAGADGKALKHSRGTPGEAEPATDGTLLWESAGALATCGVALVTELIGAGDVQPDCPPLRDHKLVSQYDVASARASRTLRLRQIASVVPSVLHAIPTSRPPGWPPRLAPKGSRPRASATAPSGKSSGRAASASSAPMSVGRPWPTPASSISTARSTPRRPRRPRSSAWPPGTTITTTSAT